MTWLDHFPLSLGISHSCYSYLQVQTALAVQFLTEYGRLQQLQVFSVYRNALTGTLPTEVGVLTNLTYLDLSVNHFNGTIPTELALFSDLQYLNVSVNHLTGTIPSVLGLLDNLCKYLYGCCYSVLLPGFSPLFCGWLTSIAVLIAAAGISLYSNNFTGTVPLELCMAGSLIEYCFPLTCHCSTNCINKCLWWMHNVVGVMSSTEIYDWTAIPRQFC